jgi:plasmid replication initiation protein
MRQANDFIESTFEQEYSEQELKTIEFIISQTTKADIELANNDQIKRIELSAPAFAKMINANVEQIYRDANHLSEALMNKKINFKYIDEKGRPAFEKQTFLTSMSYKSGIIKIGINPFVLPYFLEIKKQFTEFNLRYLISMGSSYGIKLYKLLKQYQTIGSREISITDLRIQLGIGVETTELGDYVKYKLYSGFKRDVIETAKYHINTHTDIQIEYDEIKLGRKFQKIKFYIHTKLTQLKQAKIVYLDYVKNQKPDTKSKFSQVKLLIVEYETKKQDPFSLKLVKEGFEWFVTNKISQYDPESCTPLQYFGRDTFI